MESKRYICRKTYTNGRDDEVKETIFCLSVVEDKKTGKSRVINLTDNTIWDREFVNEDCALAAIKNGSWSIIEEREQNKAYTFNQWQKERQYDIPHKLNSLADNYPTLTWLQAQYSYASAVKKVLSEADEEYIDAGTLSWGRGRVKAAELFEKELYDKFRSDSLF